MCPNYHFSYGVDRKQRKMWTGREERQICKEIGTGGLRGWCDTVFLVLLLIVCSFTSWPCLYGWNLFQAGKQTRWYAESCICGGGWLRCWLMWLSSAAAALKPLVSCWPQTAALEWLAFSRDFTAAPLQGVLMDFPLLSRTILETEYFKNLNSLGHGK